MNKIIGYFSGALIFLSAIVFLGDQSSYDPNFEALMSKLFVPAIIGYIAIVAAVKFKQSKEGLSL
jgi:hypothetical protein